MNVVALIGRIGSRVDSSNEGVHFVLLVSGEKPDNFVPMYASADKADTILDAARRGCEIAVDGFLRRAPTGGLLGGPMVVVVERMVVLADIRTRSSSSNRESFGSVN
ncbi:MAG: hypothetical protein JWM90_1565 [Thermoleophilia bacterium]|nr:hypothetical protein [Thermoleophilia bacterium]